MDAEKVTMKVYCSLCKKEHEHYDSWFCEDCMAWVCRERKWEHYCLGGWNVDELDVSDMLPKRRR